MRAFTKKMNGFLLMSMAVGLMFLVSCDKNDPTAQPDLPPEGAFIMDFSDFNDTTGKRGKMDFAGAGAGADSTRWNWFHAAINVLVWDVVLVVTLAVPVAAYAEAFKHEPTWDATRLAWVWTYDYSVGAKTYTAELLGRVFTTEVHWQMFISQSNGWQDVLWYTGISEFNGGHGTWELNRNANNPEAFLGIEWFKNDDGTSSIKYTNIVAGGPEEGGYIEYGIVGDPDLDVYYDIYNKGQNNLTAIKWQRADKHGEVTDEKRFGDTDRHCWSTTLEDVACQ